MGKKWRDGLVEMRGMSSNRSDVTYMVQVTTAATELGRDVLRPRGKEAEEEEEEGVAELTTFALTTADLTMCDGSQDWRRWSSGAPPALPPSPTASPRGEAGTCRRTSIS